MPVVLASQFDSSNLAFGELRTLQSGAKSVNVTYDGAPLQMQLSNLDVPYGLNVEDKYGPVKYSVNLSLNGYDSNPKVKSVFDALNALDERVMAEAIDKNWLRKPGMTQQIMSQMKLYKATVKFSEDATTGARKPYPPTVKASLRKKKDGAFETVFYDSDKKEIKDVPLEDLIVKRMQVTVLVECTGAWISSVGCGLSWKVKQLKVVSRPEGVGRGYGFVDEDEEPVSRSAPRSAPAAPAKNNFANAFEDDDDALDDEEALAAPAPAPKAASVVAAPAPPAEDVEPPSAPKKTIIKKKVAAKA